MATYGYIRVSTAEQAEDDRTSLETQRRKIEGIAFAADWTLDRVFIEAGASGGIPLQLRPAGGELWVVLAPGDRLIAAKLDRLFRSAADALTVADNLSKRGIDLVLLDIGIDPVNRSATGKMFFTVLVAMAEFERGRIKERQMETQATKRASGFHLGGSAPFGFIVQGKGRIARLQPDPLQQEAIATMRAMRTCKKSLRKIQDAVLAQHGYVVSHQTVKAVLERSWSGQESRA